MSAKKDQKKKVKDKLKVLRKAAGLREKPLLPKNQVIKDTKKDKIEQKTWNEVIQEIWGGGFNKSDE